MDTTNCDAIARHSENIAVTINHPPTPKKQKTGNIPPLLGTPSPPLCLPDHLSSNQVTITATDLSVLGQSPPIIRRESATKHHPDNAIGKCFATINAVKEPVTENGVYPSPNTEVQHPHVTASPNPRSDTLISVYHDLKSCGSRSNKSQNSHSISTST